jgi:ABC-type ATPase involved in cell division
MEQDQRIIVGVYHLSKTFGKHFSLHDINLQVTNGEFVFLVGRSGAGKSTLLRMIYMDDFPSSGQVVVGSHVSTKMKRSTIPNLRRKIGIVFQDFRLLDDRTVFENVALALKVAGAGISDVKHQVTDILMRVGLYHKRYDFPHELSGGEQQRVAIARAVLMATHDLDLVKSFGQRIIYLDGGRVVKDKDMIYVGDLREKIADSKISEEADRLEDRDITGDRGNRR